MGDSSILPGPRSWPNMPPEWFRFFRSLDTEVTAGSDAPVIDPSQFLSSDTSITGTASVQAVGTLASGNVTLRLVADIAAPGNGYVYGTTTTGGKGWQALSGYLVQGTGITLTTGLDGLVTIDADATSTDFTRIDAAGDIRVAADGSLRICA